MIDDAFDVSVVSDLQREEESSLVEELRVQLAQRERELQIMKEGAEELNSLRQQNYLLQSKVHKHTHNTEAFERKHFSQPFSYCCMHVLLPFTWVIENGGSRL